MLLSKAMKVMEVVSQQQLFATRVSFCGNCLRRSSSSVRTD